VNRTNNKKRSRGCLISILVFLLVCAVIIIFAGLISAFIYFQTIPSIEELTPSPIAETSKVYALDESLLTEFHAEENREIISFNKMSQYIKDAIVAVEDKRFYDHQGVDYRRIIGALIADIRSRKIVQGGSTITQQYVKNVYFSPEQTLRRKINEAIIAIQLERHYTKDKILEMYLNTIFFGAGSYGIEKAAQTYFNVHATDLTIPQAALLAGLVRSPEIYNPFNDLEKAKARRNLILKLMYDQGFIDKDEYLSSLTTPVQLNPGQESGGDGTKNRIAPYFIDYVKQQLYEKKFTDYDVFKGGLRIYTTLDLDLQKKAEEAIKKVFPEDPGPSYALVSIDPKNGYIYALIGGKDYAISKFNTATQGKRQPGSVFKTLVLMESIRQHISPNDRYNPNGPITIDMPSGPDWKVENYGGQTFETNEMTVVDATIHSVNVVYAQLMMKVGAENVEKLCSEMDISDIGSNPAIALGGLEKGITPLDVTKVFSTLAANGEYREPVCILKITDSEGKILYEYDPEKNEKNHRVLDSPVAYYVTSLLQRVIIEGTGKGANIGRPAAGKTGTTSDYKDAWFGGYTPELATVVWMGYLESNKPMEKINDRTVVGGTFPADIWREFMSAALKDRPVSDFEAPDSELIDVEVCTESGLLPTFWCPKEKLGFMIFIKGKEPTEVCNIHNKVAVPDVMGKHIEEARQIFADINFIINEIYEFNDIYNENIVFKQEPEPGSILESLTGEPLSINLYISKGLQTFQMPDLIGLAKDDAEQIVNSLGLGISEIIYDYSTEQPSGKIFAQNPIATSTVNKLTSITIYISMGENPEGTIPDVIGMTEQVAFDALNNDGFKNITVITEESKSEIDKVFAQIPESGTTYTKISEVIIKISKGIMVPDVVGMKKNDAVTILEDLGFTVTIIPDLPANNNVTSQIPAADSYINFGETVAIEIEDTGTTETTETTGTTDSTDPTETTETTPETTDP
jgi:penicillin-binding protein 1A